VGWEFESPLRYLSDNFIKINDEIILQPGDGKKMTKTEEHIRSLPAYQRQHLWKYVLMAEKLRDYREAQDDARRTESGDRESSEGC